jgi:hypothetical protein
MKMKMTPLRGHELRTVRPSFLIGGVAAVIAPQARHTTEAPQAPKE